MQIGKQICPQHAVIRSSLVDAPGVGKRLAEIKASDGKAFVGERLSQVPNINRRDDTATNAAVAATFSVSSERWFSKQEEANGKTCAGKHSLVDRRSCHREQIKA